MGTIQGVVMVDQGGRSAAVSTNVWWGMVKILDDQQFDWFDYDQLGDTIINGHLKRMPILGV